MLSHEERHLLKTVADQQKEIITKLTILTSDLGNLSGVVAKHEKILSGNGKDGLCTTVSKVVDAVDGMAEELWDSENGVTKKLNNIMERKKQYDEAVSSATAFKERKSEYDEAVKKINNVEVKVTTFATGIALAIQFFLSKVGIDFK